MSVDEWGGLKQPITPAPDPEPDREHIDRATRSGDDSTNLIDFEDYDNGHLIAVNQGVRWNMPGGGEPGDGCQEWRPHGVCDECGRTSFVQQHCDKWACPNCWTRVANRFAVNAATRQQAFRSTQPADHHRQWAHAVVSPEEGDIDSKRQLFDNRSKAADIAIEKGFRGCSVVAHSHRPSDIGKEIYEATVDRDDEGDALIGFWVWLRNESSDIGVETADLIEWSPHYHIIGPTSPGMDTGSEQDDWLYNLIRFNEHDLTAISTSEDSHEELYGTYRYLASHIFRPANSSRQMITWHGCLANSVFVESADEEWQYQKPSQGVRDAIKRAMESLSETTPDRDETDESGDDGDALEPCPCSDCSGELIAVWDVSAYLDHVDPPPEVAEKMRVARDWAMGDIEPPGGLRNPRCEADARDALYAMLSSDPRHTRPNRRKQVDNINPSEDGKSRKSENRNTSSECGAPKCNGLGGGLH